MSGYGKSQSPWALLVANSLAEIAALGAAAQATARGNLGLGSTGTVQFDYLGLGVARTLGRLQIVSGTTSADGIYFGSDFAIYRAGGGVLEYAGSVGTIRFNVNSTTPSINMGGNTSSFPAFKRNGTGIEVRLADDSGLSSISTSALNATGNCIANGGLCTGAGVGFILDSSADGVGRITNNARADFGRLQFGGTTNAFPALKRSGTSIQVRRADDSADGSLTALDLTLSGVLQLGNAAVAGAVVPTHTVTLKDSTGTTYRVPCLV